MARRLKFSRDPEALRWSGRAVAGVLGALSLHGSPVVLVPVPMFARKRRARGFDHAHALAMEVARRRNVPCRSDLLCRIRDTRPQGDPLVMSRRANVAGAFQLRRMRAALDPAAFYILVDDVVTSGSTLRACARVLRRGGLPHGEKPVAGNQTPRLGQPHSAIRVGAVTLARAVPRE